MSAIGHRIRGTLRERPFHVQHLGSKCRFNMSPFQFGFSHVSNSSPGCSQDQGVPVPAHIPTLGESGLGAVEYESTVSSVSDLSDPTATNKKRTQRGTYTHYTPSNRAKIGKYALENGNLRALHHFSAEFPNLKESTVRNF